MLTDAQQARLIELALTGTDARIVAAVTEALEKGIGPCDPSPFDYGCKNCRGSVKDRYWCGIVYLQKKYCPPYPSNIYELVEDLTRDSRRS